MSYQRNWLLAAVLAASSATASGVLASEGDWSRLYAGATIGARSVDADWKTTSYSAPDSTPLSFGTSPDASLNSSATYFGAYAGKNWEVMPKLLVGVEGRLGTAKNEKKHITIPGVGPDAPPDYSYVEVNSSLQTDLVGRIGYLITPKIHLYGTVGFSALSVEVSATCPADTDFCNPAMGTQHKSETETMMGWVAGVGIESTVMDNVLLRLEYDMADYGDMSFSGLPALSGESYGFTSDVSPASSTVTLGVAYMF